MKGIKTLSLLFGVFMGLICWAALHFICPGDAWMAIPTGIGCAIALHAVIQVGLHLEEKRYRKAAAAFPEPAIFSCEARARDLLLRGGKPRRTGSEGCAPLHLPRSDRAAANGEQAVSDSDKAVV